MSSCDLVSLRVSSDRSCGHPSCIDQQLHKQALGHTPQCAFSKPLVVLVCEGAPSLSLLEVLLWLADSSVRPTVFSKAGLLRAPRFQFSGQDVRKGLPKPEQQAGLDVVTQQIVTQVETVVLHKLVAVEGAERLRFSIQPSPTSQADLTSFAKAVRIPEEWFEKDPLGRFIWDLVLKGELVALCTCHTDTLTHGLLHPCVAEILGTATVPPSADVHALLGTGDMKVWHDSALAAEARLNFTLVELTGNKTLAMMGASGQLLCHCLLSDPATVQAMLRVFAC